MVGRCIRAWLLAATASAAGCADPVDSEATFDWVTEGTEFVQSAAVRRAVLEGSLVEPGNGYGRLRLENYATDGGWDALPEWNPPVTPVLVADVQRGGRLEVDALRLRPMDVPDAALLTDAQLLALGEAAFFGYPVQSAPLASQWLQAPDGGASSGLEADVFGRVGGLVAVQQADGSVAPWMTCATCHGDVVQGVRVAGRTNERMLGGRVDVTADGVDNPQAIVDLRPVSLQTHLHAAGTVVNGPAELAVRVDTLITTSLGQRQRAPRLIAWALARYLWSLEQTLPPVQPAVGSAGRQVFDRECSACHSVEGRSVEPVAMELVGTDEAAGRSSERGTGSWRVPSLRGVSLRSQYLHTANFRSLDAMFAPDRDPDVGHTFGLALPFDERTALLVFLQGL